MTELYHYQKFESLLKFGELGKPRPWKLRPKTMKTKTPHHSNRQNDVFIYTTFSHVKTHIALIAIVLLCAVDGCFDRLAVWCFSNIGDRLWNNNIKTWKSYDWTDWWFGGWILPDQMEVDFAHSLMYKFCNVLPIQDCVTECAMITHKNNNKPKDVFANLLTTLASRSISQSKALSKAF